jgi:hypothetical protein
MLRWIINLLTAHEDAAALRALKRKLSSGMPLEMIEAYEAYCQSLEYSRSQKTFDKLLAEYRDSVSADAVRHEFGL